MAKTTCWISFSRCVEACLSGETTANEVEVVFCGFELGNRAIEEIIDSHWQDEWGWQQHGDQARAREIVLELSSAGKLKFAEARDGLIPHKAAMPCWNETPRRFAVASRDDVVWVQPDQL